MTVEPPGGSGAPMSDRMQSLLSRAVEDQLSEQRQLAGVLSDVRAQLQRITSDIAGLRAEAGSSGSSDSALASVSADVREAVRLLGERLDGVARLVQQRGSDLAELRAATDQLHTVVRGQGEALGGIGNGLAALPAFGERIGGLQDNLAALHERLTGLDGVGDSVTALQQRVDAVDQGLRELRSAFAAIGARMAELPGRADLDAVAGRSATPLTEVGERLAELDSGISALTAQVTSLAGRPEPAGQVDALRAELARFAEATHEEIDVVQQRLVAVDRRLDEVLEALTPAEPAEADHATDGAEEEYAEDPVLAELADLREALLGEDGLAARMDAAGADDIDARVTSAVEQAVAASEERLTAHIDEAVLALAEALLRRRGGRPAGPAQPSPAQPSPAQPVAQPEPDETGVADAAEATDATQEVDEPREADDAAEVAPAGGAQPVSRWQTPAAEAAAPTAPAGEDGSRRRRPWWRPGD